MASVQAQAVNRYWLEVARTAAEPGDGGSDGESWGDLTAEPRGVDYVETEVCGLPAMWLLPKHRADDRVLLCLHGGGFVSGSIYTHRKLFAHLAKAAGVRGLVFDYHYAPGSTHPTQVDEATDVYGWLLDQGRRPDHIALTGDSCGGGLAITSQLRARERGLPLPAAAMPFSPWVDMEAVGESYLINRERDAFFRAELVRDLARAFLGRDGDVRDRLANPLYADLTGLAPIYIQAGGDEVLLDDAKRLAERARLARVDVRLDIFPEMQHTFQMAAGRAPEADAAIGLMAEWVRPRLGL
jgi:epsilon-lactone hydrolase